MEWSVGVELSVRVDPSIPTTTSHVVDVLINPQSSSPCGDASSTSSSSPQSSLHTSPRNSSPQSPPHEGPSIARGFRSKAQTWKSLKESIPHAMTLVSLEREEKLFEDEVWSHKKSVRRLRKALFEVLSVYAMAQGFLFAAVAQTTIFTCADWWGPVLIAVTVTLGTLFGVLDKLLSIGHHKEEARKFKARQMAVYEVIDTLRWEGSQFDLENADPQNSSRQAQAPGKREVVSMYGLLVLSFLVGFSCLVVISFFKMLCSESGCKCKQR